MPKPMPLSELHRQHPISFWAISLFTVGFLFIAPFYKGLFNGDAWIFHGPLYLSMLLSSLTLSFLWYPLFKSWKWKLEMLPYLLVWLIPLAYLTSAFVEPATSYGAYNMFFVSVLCASFFSFGMFLSQSSIGFTLIQTSLLTSGSILTLYGLMNWFGFATYQDAVMYDGTILRLSGIFQYANTNAAFLIAFYFILILTILQSKKKYIHYIAGFMVLPALLSIMLTFSRGAMVLIPLIALLIMLSMRLSNQLLLILYTATGIGLVTAIYTPILNFGSEIHIHDSSNLSLSPIFMLFLGSIVFSGITVSMQRHIVPFIMKLDRFLRVKFIIPGLVIVASGMIVFLIYINPSAFISILPSSLEQRFSNMFDSSFTDRQFFVTDSLAIFQHYPLFGRGGNAWAALFPYYQSAPYFSNQAHSFGFQFLIETGIIGILSLTIILAFTLYIVAKRLRQEKNRDQIMWFSVLLLPFLTHSLIDFDLSFVYIGAVCSLAFGGLTSPTPSKEGQTFTLSWRRAIFPTVLFIIAMITVFINFMHYTAHRSFLSASEQALQQQVSFSEISQDIDTALSYYAYHPTYTFQKMNIIQQVYTQTKDPKYLAEAEQLLSKMKSREPYSLQLVEYETNLLLLKGQYADAIVLASQLVNDTEWSLYSRQLLIKVYYAAAQNALNKDDISEVLKYSSEAIVLYDQFLDKLRSNSSNNKFNELTDQMISELRSLNTP